MQSTIVSYLFNKIRNLYTIAHVAFIINSFYLTIYLLRTQRIIINVSCPLPYYTFIKNGCVNKTLSLIIQSHYIHMKQELYLNGVCIASIKLRICKLFIAHNITIYINIKCFGNSFLKMYKFN